jgi:hypothetical protein
MIMRKDPIVAEIHKIRAAHAKRFRYDLNSIFADIRKRQAKEKNVVDFSQGRMHVAQVCEDHSPYGDK